MTARFTLLAIAAVLIAISLCAVCGIWMLADNRSQIVAGSSNDDADNRLDAEEFIPARVMQHVVLADGTVIQYRMRSERRSSADWSEVRIEAATIDGKLNCLVPPIRGMEYGRHQPHSFLLCHPQRSTVGALYQEGSNAMFHIIELHKDETGTPAAKQVTREIIPLGDLLRPYPDFYKVKLHSLTYDRGRWQFEVDTGASNVLMVRKKADTWLPISDGEM